MSAGIVMSAACLALRPGARTVFTAWRAGVVVASSAFEVEVWVVALLCTPFVLRLRSPACEGLALYLCFLLVTVYLGMQAFGDGLFGGELWADAWPALRAQQGSRSPLGVRPCSSSSKPCLIHGRALVGACLGLPSGPGLGALGNCVCPPTVGQG